jgi:NAD(P)-dependent dehydrogenase (short-subunit alcohol dehydrogenase family)
LVAGVTQQHAPFGLAGRVALVTGGASGIGAGISRALAAAGATVVIADIDTEGAARQAAVLTGEGMEVVPVALDLAQERSIVRVCGEITAQRGAPWILVNNAGLQDREEFLGSTADEWDRMNRINARGPFLMTREIARAMIEAGDGGRIINIASAALRGSIVHGLVAYSSSKGALLGLSGASAFELAEHGITVNTVLPGGVPTAGAISAKGPPPSGPASQRPPPLGLCEPADIAAAVLFFASPAAGRITNQVLAVDGGFSVT